MSEASVHRAAMVDLDQLAKLFDAYRVFYKQSSNIEAAKTYLERHLRNDTSVVFVAKTGAQYLGFTQLYKSYSSISMQVFWILNDLYVDADARGKGIGELLLRHTQQFAIENSAKGIGLETALDNPAQKLYQRLGWKKDEEYLHFFWTNTF